MSFDNEHSKSQSAALCLAEDGFYVFPVASKETDRDGKHNTKKPLCKSWREESTNDPDEIQTLWERAGNAANMVGIDCGKSRLVVIDCDVNKDTGKPDGLANFEAFCFSMGLPLPATYTIQTPSGGSHFYFSLPADFESDKFQNHTSWDFSKQRQTKPGEPQTHIDIRAYGGFIVAEGSTRWDGKAYKRIGDYNVIEELPEWFADHLMPLPEEVKEPKNDKASTGDCFIQGAHVLVDGNDQYARKAFNESITAMALATEGHRNDTLNRLAFNLSSQFVPHRMHADGLGQALERVAIQSGLPAKEAAEAHRMIEDGQQKRKPNYTGMPGIEPPKNTRERRGNIEADVVERAPTVFSPLDAEIMALFSEREKRPPAIPTGLDHVDKLLNGGLRPGLYLLGAAPGMGKTALALQIADNIAASGRNVLFYSLEMVKEELIDRSLCRISKQQNLRKPEIQPLTLRAIEDELRQNGLDGASDNLVKPLMEYVNGTVDGSRKGIARHLMVIDTDEPYIEAIETSVNAFYDQNPDGVVFVDYLQLLRIAADPRTSADPILRLADISRRLKVLSKRAPLVVISSVNRESYYNVPGLDAFKASGDIEFSANAALVLAPAGYTDSTSENRTIKATVDSMRDMPKPLELHLVKGRALALGKCGILFDGASYLMQSTDADHVNASYGALQTELTSVMATDGLTPRRRPRG